MALLDSYKANKAISIVLAYNQVSAGELKNAVVKIKNIGESTIPKLISAISDSHNNKPLENLLINFLDNQTLPYYIDALADEDKSIVTHIMRLLIKSEKYDPNRLIQLFEDPEIHKNVLVQILSTHKQSLNSNKLFESLDKVDKKTRILVFKVLEDIVQDSMIPKLLVYAESKDPGTRLHVARLLARFSTEQVRDKLLQLLKDPHNEIRLTALDGLGKMKIPVPAREICPALKDPNLTIQAKAIETLVKIEDPSVVKYLVEILQDESEYIRRAAVEVLNEVADPRAIKDLLSAMRDQDWWVKVRAADALGSIGGPKVVEAVLGLLNDDDEFLRRTAVEILNSIKDERAVDFLINALEDQDWWVRERAADALAKLGSDRAIPALVEMLDQQPDSAKIAIRALTEIGNTDAISPLISKLQENDVSLKKNIIEALGELSDHQHAEDIESALKQVQESSDEDVRQIASTTLDTVIAKNRFLAGKRSNASSGSRSTTTTEKSDSSLQKTSTSDATVSHIDPAMLKPGMVLSDRYEIVKHIGKGAFGFVILVKDRMVNEEIILKFLNPQMATDESVIQRFVYELRYTRKITHPNVIRIYDFLTFGKSYAISMEYFESHSLSYEVKNKLTTDINRNIKIIIDICNGLKIAHNNNVVHRDIKPANILVDKNNVVKIVDFGLAAAASQGDSRITKSGILVGTPTYMAPEQVRGRKIDTRTDIYSLGIVMYEMFTGRPPFKEKDHMATLFKHVEGNATPAKEKNPKISDELNDIIMHAIHVDPTLRYQQIDELGNDLQALLDKETN
ncbi:Serine/threonine protein kinase PrkC, regulator of stationary phase [hydrothermal vent metagenome]|uniref:Serine/threonine protein kinase PrkC, regulator of stationary phase n=1 Tax=hydrothermal vent metagenome TaxID=652676 RepID=A0A3B1BAI0_9ZZZZ